MFIVYFSRKRCVGIDLARGKDTENRDIKWNSADNEITHTVWPGERTKELKR
jgi:hypothetical protein